MAEKQASSPTPTPESDETQSTQQTGPPGPLTQLVEAKRYMAENSIPQMFECLLASLMLERPDDYVTFLDKKLDSIKEADEVNWESFIQPLHPHRDPVRRALFGDGQTTKVPAGDNRSFSRVDSATQRPSELFHLTEAQE
ncbi:hypothetical protein LSAT2_008425 [Lamellibrachia satsuma]|nr:hypothetical protein LSAT2_008425 [Lamellibrachia satsuma]